MTNEALDPRPFCQTVRRAGGRVTAQSLTAWRERLGWNKSEAARQLGVSRTTYDAYEAGKSKIPVYIALACKCLLLGEPPAR